MPATRKPANMSIPVYEAGVPMAAYLVADATDDTIILVDTGGRRHLARALHGTPPAGAELHGPRPTPGFALLSQASTQRLCRVIFEQVDVGRGA
jgi:hypothetical protein